MKNFSSLQLGLRHCEREARGNPGEIYKYKQKFTLRIPAWIATPSARNDVRYVLAMTISLLLFFSVNSWALTCKQSEIIPLAKLAEETETLTKQFLSINHIETLPQKMTPQSQGFILTTVQVLICGELIPQSPTLSTQPGQVCQFDSNCAMPMRCQNNKCALPSP